jgi:hypothetical protein
VTYKLNREKINDHTGVTAKQKQIRKEYPAVQFQEGEKYTAVISGFIAQEVEDAAKKIGYEFSGVDAPKNESDYYGLRYAEFVVPLVKAVQEQQKIIEDLKIYNTELEKRVEALEARIKLL